MPRRPHIKFADITQLTVQRRINREPCFFADEDYHCYPRRLLQSAADYFATASLAKSKSPIAGTTVEYKSAPRGQVLFEERE